MFGPRGKYAVLPDYRLLRNTAPGLVRSPGAPTQDTKLFLGEVISPASGNSYCTEIEPGIISWQCDGRYLLLETVFQKGFLAYFWIAFAAVGVIGLAVWSYAAFSLGMEDRLPVYISLACLAVGLVWRELYLRTPIQRIFVFDRTHGTVLFPGFRKSRPELVVKFSDVICSRQLMVQRAGSTVKDFIMATVKRAGIRVAYCHQVPFYRDIHGCWGLIHDFMTDPAWTPEDTRRVPAFYRAIRWYKDNDVTIPEVFPAGEFINLKLSQEELLRQAHRRKAERQEEAAHLSS